MSRKYLDETGLTYLWSKLKAYFQVKLVSGTNIKTVNSNSLLGSGNVAVQETLVSGTNIKTVNNTTLLGGGNLNIPTGVSDVLVNGSSVVSNDEAVITIPTALSGFTNDAGFRRIYASTADPTSSDGSDGDVWLKYTVSSS